MQLNKKIYISHLDLMIINKEERYYLKEMWEAETLIVKRFRLLSHKFPLLSLFVCFYFLIDNLLKAVHQNFPRF